MKSHSLFGLFPKACVLFLVALTFSFNSFSQQKPSKYTLLWQISGKGLKKPSFLFGSMHVKDNRVFNFSDSVMKAIESCSGFVMEIHPDSLIKSILTPNVSNGIDEKVEKMLSKEQKADLMRRFEKKNGYTPDSSVLSNPILISSLMDKDRSRPDDMQTFVDAYLYGIARTMKKKVFGLEEPKDQLNTLYDSEEKISAILDQDEEAEDSALEEMIELYASGNLDEVTDLINDGYMDKIELTARNKVMINGIIKLLKTENVFITVGVAHLPNKDGLIALLKDAGYTVKPVEAAFTGVAKTYKIDPLKMDWYNYEDKQNDFKVSFPTEPVLTKKFGNVKILISSDLSNGTIYTTSTNYTGPLVKMTAEAYLDTVLTNFASDKSTQIINKTKGNMYGGISLEAELKKSDKFLRTILLFKNNTFYNLSIESDRDNLKEAFSERFFRSLEINEPAVVKSQEWVTFKDDTAAFSLKMPTKPDVMSNVVENPGNPDYPYFITLYMATDKVNLLNYLIKYNDYPEGMYLANKNEAFNSLTNVMGSKGKIIGEPKVIFKDGYEGREIDMLLLGSYCEVQLFIRGNRTYMLMRQNMAGEKKAPANEFFNSFNFLKYAETTPITFALADVKVNLPKSPKLIPENPKKVTSYLHTDQSYFSLNKKTGGLYYAEASTISKYYRIKDADSLIIKLANVLKAEGTSFSKVEKILNKPFKGNIYSYTDSAMGNDRKTKIWIDGNRIYCQYLVSTKEEMESNIADKFFNETIYPPVKEQISLEKSKASLIFKDLVSTDTTIRKEAFGALHYYKFDKEELPLIHAALKVKYTDDTTAFGTRSQLIGQLHTLKDPSNITLLKELFNDTKNPDELRATLLYSIPKIDSLQFDWYLNNLIKTPQFKIDNYWDLFSPLTDSLSYSAKNIDKLLLLNEFKDYRPILISIFLGLTNDKTDSTYLTVIKNEKEKITSHAMEDLNEYLAGERKLSSPVYQYLSILPKIELPKLTDEFTSKVILLDSLNYLITAAVVARIESGLPIDQKIMQTQLDSLYSRYDILYAMHKANQLDKIPLKYKKQDEFAKLLLYNYLGDEENYPETINLLGKVKEGNETYYVFEYGFVSGDEKTSFIGLVGPFDELNAKLDFDKPRAFSNGDIKTDDWQTQAEVMIAVMKKE
ncbi:TraB/GumN family protein [Pedobacter nototheniae]|uniref:TraB/GumN family protein n=1 Tax=Pedobacter nototheniae TaxID=2488994 RepID=UPI001040A283|nr:TraB/GumN family protein [Pedobacter nototheniae]